MLIDLLLGFALATVILGTAPLPDSPGLGLVLILLFLVALGSTLGLGLHLLLA